MSTRKTTSQPPPPTEVYTIQSPHFSQAPLSANLDHLDEVAAAHASNEFEHLVDLIIARAVVPLSPFDRVEVIDHALTTVQVRVVDGGERGRTGWIPSAWLHSAGTAVLTTTDETRIAAQAA
ncbi:MAG TPA: hypothetical protein VHX44_10610 [Planctomycetota bacterium]|jgi:hypothetical protein|nr:hypothetical protein [Planctomycetota bacterium]